MYICDCHCDTLVRAYHDQESLYDNNYHLDIERIIKNGGGMQFFAICMPTKYRYSGGVKYTLQIIDKYNQELKSLNDRQVGFIRVESKKDLQLLDKSKIALLLSIEDGAAIEGSLETLRIFYQLGVRCMSLTWNYRNDLADGIQDSITGGGLTQIGRDVVKEMNRLGMLVDVSHLSPGGFWDVIELSQKPIIASHSNAKALCNIPRNLTDEQIKAIAQGNGVIGINFYSKFLEEKEELASIDSIYRHIDHILNLVGDEYIALGTDFDGVSALPNGFTGVEDIPQVIEYLREKNYSSDTIEKITYKNVLRILNEVLS